MLKPEDIVVDIANYPTRGMLVGIPVGVKITHKPTGTTVIESSERSQHRNRELALQKLEKMVADAQTTGAAELPDALRLADALRKMDEAKKYHPSGPGGQMLGCEQYRLIASGFTFEYLQSAAAELRRLHAQVEALSAAQAGVPAATLHDIDAGVEVMAYLRESRAPHSIYAKMSACLFGDPDRAARAAPQPATADAQRYRWLRHGDNDEKVLCNGPVAKDYWYLLRGEKLDAAIDAALAAQREDKP